MALGSLLGAVAGGLAGYAAGQAGKQIVNTINSDLNRVSGAQFGVSNGQFPSNLSEVYHMRLQFYKYQRANINSVGSASLLNSWKLPIPANMVDAQGVNYGEEPIGPALGGGANAIMGLDQNTPTGGNALLDAAKNVAGAAGVGAAVGAINAVSPALANVLSAKFGMTANPFLTVLFKNPNYKKYNFSWRFYPRNPQESQALAALINTIKYHQLPTRSVAAGGAVLGYPSLVKPTIVAGNSQLYPFKYGVIENTSVNYAPEGVPSFHRGGKPSTVEVSLSILEIEYFLKDSFQGSL